MHSAPLVAIFVLILNLTFFSPVSAQVSDLEILQSCLGASPVGQCSNADFNNDAVISLQDYLLFADSVRGDFNADALTDLRAIVDNQDRLFLAGCISQNTLPGCGAADLNNDGLVDNRDMDIFNGFVIYDLTGDNIVDYGLRTSPLFQNIHDVNVDEGGALGFYIWAKDISNDVVTYASDGVPGGASLTTVIMGDVNNDGLVDSLDVDLLQKKGFSKYEQRFDLNNDNLIDQQHLGTMQSLIGESRRALIFNWQPGNRDAGVYTLQFSAADSFGLTSHATLKLTVNDRDVIKNYYSYGDVLLVVNDQSVASQQIGDYFAQARGIPANRIAVISTPETETISRTTFEQEIRQPLESFLINNQLESQINYIVTTKGVPLRITGIQSNGSDRASVDSELSLILGPYSNQIGTINFVPNPYFEVDFPFSREMFGIYLVTRLTGYSVDDVIALIDRAGQAEQFGTFVLDVDPSKDSGLGTALGNQWLRDAAVVLENAGQVVLLDQSTTFVTGQSNVLGYASWGSNDANDTNNAIPNFTWAPGSIAETFVSTSARTFTAPAVYGQSLIADLIAEGVTGAKGYVYEPFLDSMARPHILFARYTGGYSLADSYYAASVKLGWQGVVIGDPKMAISRAISNR